MENIIHVEHLNKQFLVDRQPMEILRDINLDIRKGEFVTIVGHSGCGKSTLLKIICGLVDYQDGIVERNGHKVEGPGPNCGMVFQDHRLLPWLKIKDNVGFGLDGYPKEEKEKLITEAPSGIIGLETSLSLGITSLVRPGHLTMMELLEKMTINPARLYHLPYGTIEEGGAADFVLFNPDETWIPTTYASKSSNSPFTGKELYGKIKYTICRGKIIYHD